MAKKTLSRKNRFYLVSGEDLEVWAGKALLGLFYSQPRDSVLDKYTIANDVVETFIHTSRLPDGCGLYLNRQLGTRVDHKNKEIAIGTITHKNEKRLTGIIIDIVGLSFDFFIDPIGHKFLPGDQRKLYRPSPLIFEGRGRSHVIFFSWPSDPSRVGMTFSMNRTVF